MNGDSSLIKSASVFSSPNREGCSKIATSTRVNVLRIPLAFQREVDEDSEKVLILLNTHTPDLESAFFTFFLLHLLPCCVQ